MYDSKVLFALVASALGASAAVSEDTVEETVQNEVVFEPEYAVSALQVEQGAYVDASGPMDMPELDLTIDVMRALTPEQLNEALGSTVNTRMSGTVTPADQQLELIEVRATREQHEPIPTPIPFGLASIAWALQNPTQAWRILFPAMSS